MICFHSLNYWYLPQRLKTFSSRLTVVICFHSLNYWYLPQHISISSLFRKCCDLLSFFELLIFTTTRYKEMTVQECCDLLSFFELLIFTTTWLSQKQTDNALWFAFILWTTDIYHNNFQLKQDRLPVVICFHSLNYWYLPQHILFQRVQTGSCDLLSFFELLIFTTTKVQNGLQEIMLWFAFILWTTDIYHNWDWYETRPILRCDLLSFFELLIFTTTIFSKNEHIC